MPQLHLIENNISHPQPRPLLSSEQQRQRMVLLPPTDRQLLAQVLTGRLPLREIAGRAGLVPGTLCRRVARLRRRLEHPVIAALASRGHLLSQEVYLAGMARFAAGKPVAVLARELGITKRRALNILRYLEGWAGQELPADHHLSRDFFPAA